MWKELWDDFAARAHRLREGGGPHDDVDRTIAWQLEGNPTHVGAALAHEALQLPELYSGCPWQTSAHWVAFLTINPSMDPDELYPTLALYEELGASEELISFFEQRFHAECHHPLRHGRPPGAFRKPTAWKRVASQLGAQATTNATWTSLDNMLRAAAGYAKVECGNAPLGNLAAIIDVVPWKFRAWRMVPVAMKDALLAQAKEHLERWLLAHQPSLIVTVGAAAQRGLRAIYPVEMTPGADGLRRATVVRPDGHSVDVIQAPHFREIAFNSTRAPLIDALAAALRG